MQTQLKAYLRNTSYAIATNTEQLNLFDLLMDETSLKYQRRTSRQISNIKYRISTPTPHASATMQKIGSSNSKIETLVEEELLKNNLYFTKPKFLIGNVEGNPDFILPKYKIAIFCDGDFWHGYEFVKSKIKNNTEFWNAKIERNIQRDAEVNEILKQQSWKIFRFWEHAIKQDANSCIKTVLKYIKKKESQKKYLFNFVDLFSGVGGFRIPLEELGGKCLAFSEIDKQATFVYKNNFLGFNDNEIELGDITKVNKLPFEEIDIIVGGVPCQAWSVAGKMKGFDDPRGKLWDDTIRVVKLNQPKAFAFENVKGLIDPRNKESLNLIIQSFEKIGYNVVKPQLLNSYDFGLPQNRDRVFIVGIRKDLSHTSSFQYPKPLAKKTSLLDILEGFEKVENTQKTNFEPHQIHGNKIPMARNRFQDISQLNDFFIFCDTRNGHTTIHSWDITKTTEREKDICLMILKNRRKKIYGPSDGNPISFKNLQGLIANIKEDELTKLVDKKILRYKKNEGYEFVNSKNSSGIEDTYRVYLPHSKIFSTLTATGTKDVIALKSISGKTPEEYRNNFIAQIVRKKAYRPITAKEAGRLQGFPNWFAIHHDEKVAKKQFGNAVSTSVIHHIAQKIIETKVFKS